MIERRHRSDDSASLALYSECEAYRYGLERVWDSGHGALAFVMLNPSTATELRNDPTIERCERRARAMGYGGLRIVNLFAFRATQPADLRRAADPVGAENDAILVEWCGGARDVIAAWGVHGALLGRAAEVAPLLPPQTLHLGLTKAGHPRHPLYVSYARQPAPRPLAARYATPGER
ncbi:DUF1643 domain-containing protein [Aestuariicoccus sp. MJ-SS9]|uniref:DUF1643 domain-containing protein n=1 Tax=Aestuariicoccus sp. MJ-SS9 TaxID=3079855 RepID=UPI00290A421E|nr:DUF1643 domain-containing protein [Aestuariicoccus sp. MJ-SS9]MDU8911714.1 DUF1643 domain-containing protein [Aestuariicoccus sp. MJ-SS9]